MPFRPTRRLALLGIAMAFIGACGGSPADNGAPTPTGLSATSGNNQTGTVGQPLPQSLLVTVTGSDGAPLADATVTFAVTRGGGSLSTTTAVTDVSGHGATSLTLGTIAGAGNNTVSATVGSLNPLVLTATALAGPTAALGIASGGGQVGLPSAPLPLPLVATASDQYGNPVPGITMAWAIASGGGALSVPTSTTDTAGQATVAWTLGALIGSQTANATVGGASPSPLTFVATSVDIAITGIAPDTLIEGSTATITGRGFNTTIALDGVTIGGLSATVTAATATTLTVTVPTADCRPARATPVMLTVNGIALAPVAHPVQPSEALVMASGQQVILQNSGQFCLQFARSAADESYLIGVQAATEDASVLVPVLLSAEVAPGPAPVGPVHAAAPPHRAAGQAPLMTINQRRLARHFAAEGEFMARNLAQLPPPRAGLRAGQASARAPALTPSVGDTVTVQVADLSAVNSCTQYAIVKTVVRAVGTGSIWLDDVENSPGSYSPADIQGMANEFETKILPVDVAEFGAETDIDANGRTVIVITKEVWKRPNVLGFVLPGDFYGIAECAASNRGEYFYMLAPDPSRGFTVADAEWARANTLAHEFVHILQVGRRVQNGASSFPSKWELEGQATLGEEVVGFSYDGLAPGQDLGLEVAYNGANTPPDWYLWRFTWLAYYFGFDYVDGVGPRKVSGAPEACLWLGTAGSPCTSNLVYGVGWSILRWVTDQFAPAYPGGEPALQRALIDNDATGFRSLELVSGTSQDSLLAEWAATLYTDGRPIPGLSPRLTLPSWDLYDIYYGVASFGSLFEEARLTPRSRSFGNFADAMSVRAASSSYTTVSGTNRSATAIKARSLDGSPLPALMRMWVVRLK